MDAFALKQSITNELINAIDVGVVVLDSDFCVEVWNQFMENHASIKPADIVGQSLFSHFPEIDEGWLRQKSVPISTYVALSLLFGSSVSIYLNLAQTAQSLVALTTCIKMSPCFRSSATMAKYRVFVSWCMTLPIKH